MPPTESRRLEAGAASISVRLLADEPADADEFEAGAHARVANAIADLVRSEVGGKSIGLEGSWGSGKSTVVRLFRRALEVPGTTAIQVFVFDAWAHQGDPLRRTFLETLLDHLGAADWLSDDFTSDLKKKLSGRQSKVRTKSTNRLSAEGRVVTVATTLIPIGAALFANKFKSNHGWFVALGVLLLAGPLLVTIGFALAKGIAILLGGRKKRQGFLKRVADLPTLSFFAKEQETDTTTEAIERSEPTSVEFEQCFSQVIERGVTDERRLVIVLDNIDRVEEDAAKAVLATMQTFMGTSGQASADERIWILIPYDHVGLARLWSPIVRIDDTNTKTTEAPATTAAAFADKLFQVRFDAPPLVLSEWRDYLVRLLREALVGADDDDLRSVTRLRSMYPAVREKGLVSREAPTPRQLKQFVNQIGAVRRQRDDVELLHIAYYVLLRRDSVDVRTKLVNGELPDGKLLHLFNSEVRDDLAALHFGTTHTLAQQLLIGPELERAFAAGDPEPVKQLKARPGFVDALERLDFQGLAGDGAVELTRAVAVLSAGGAFDVPEVEVWATDVLDPLTRSTSMWRLDGSECGHGCHSCHKGGRGRQRGSCQVGRDNRLQALASR
jgi:KAP family P-loop domain